MQIGTLSKRGKAKNKIVVVNDDLLSWLQNWFNSKCDGDWEHGDGIKIISTDNPGWSITIELKDTGIQLADTDWDKHDASEGDWYMFQIKDNTYRGTGDSTKLVFLISKFRELVS